MKHPLTAFGARHSISNRIAPPTFLGIALVRANVSRDYSAFQQSEGKPSIRG